MSRLVVEMKNKLIYYETKYKREGERMKTVSVRNIKIGEGMTKICVPILGKTKEEIISFAKKVKDLAADLVEWRADWFEDVLDEKKVEELLLELRAIVENMPILYTYRTVREGGNGAADKEVYVTLNQKVCDMGIIDLIDVEMFSGEDIIKEIIDYAHEKNVIVVGSNHDFGGTPSQKQLVTRLQLMQHFKADIIKIAVMPNTKKDVIALLLATEEMVTKYAKCPVVSMSMSKMGVFSRISGELFGSAMTFASAGIASAPGQIPVEEMKMILELMSQE